MIFGEVPVSDAADSILAHSLRAPGIAFKKGRRLSGEDIATLTEAGIDRLIVARLEADEVHEDEAATALAVAIIGDGLTASASFTGRCNLMVGFRGILVAERERIDALNLVDEAVTLATLGPYDLVEPRQMAATIKIIPFAITRHVLDACLAVAGQGKPLLSVAALAPRKVGLLQTLLPGTKESLLDKTRDVANQRLALLDCAPAEELRCRHDEGSVAQALGTLASKGCDIVLMSGASAVIDRRDILPGGLVAAGGRVDHFGMPVDPGNLILLGDLGGHPVVGLPGCARSPKLNGFDWVLQRLVAGLPVTPREVMKMGAGGLLKEIASRPLPRAEAVEEARSLSRAPRIAAVILAAGQSRRMGKANKLLLQVDGKPMVTHVADSLLASQAKPLAVVTGHDYAAVEAALPDGRFILTHNPDFASGLSSSLKRGLGALPEEIDGLLVCLGDMPRVSPATIDRLIAAFDPLEGRAICVPTWQGKRGNPVLFARRFFAEMQEVAGDIGARALIGEHAEAVCEVPMDDDAVLVDVDTPEALAALEA
ncbi:NTP transferase domain-containing protein [Pelagibius litoralis]|uniref:NTP transferase domain-containing protein n=1 Tax=Pelagibius litoralis TaxID=374515 RepID=A0A967C4H6_9PROT|nr:molybdopterin-binding/glycosyltransferase family 2 protein [Pelagibius litoralis]NIA67106.1 NTP transferase domain-containing protein [Pelagibius litoralis]